MLLVTKSALVYDAEAKGAFGDYLAAQADVLEEVIALRGLGIKLSDIILVTECSLTRNWALTVSRGSRKSGEFSFELGVLDGEAEATISALRASETSVPVHRWSPDNNSLKRPSTIGKPEPLDDEIYTYAEGVDGIVRDQCVFLRGYRLGRRSLSGLKPRAAAGLAEPPGDRPPSPDTGVRASDGMNRPIVSDELLDDPKGVRDFPIFFCGTDWPLSCSKTTSSWIYSTISFKCVLHSFRNGKALENLSV